MLIWSLFLRILKIELKLHPVCKSCFTVAYSLIVIFTTFGGIILGNSVVFFLLYDKLYHNSKRIINCKYFDFKF